MLKKYYANISRTLAKAAQTMSSAAREISRQQLLITCASAAIMLVALAVFWNLFILPKHIPHANSQAVGRISDELIADQQKVEALQKAAQNEATPSAATEESPDEQGAPQQGGAGQAVTTGTTTREEAVSDALPEEPDLSAVLKPLEGSVIKGYGFVFSPTFKDYRFHGGIDISAVEGTGVKCPLKGVVESIASTQGLGSTVIVNHGGPWKISYSHLQGVKVQQGMTVAAGAVLGILGKPGSLEAEEGCHLHLEVLKNGEHINPLEIFDYK